MAIRTVRRFAILGSPVLVVDHRPRHHEQLVQLVEHGDLPAVTTPPAKTTHLTAPPLGISPQVSYTAAIQTTCGTIDLGLDAQQYPTAVNNFVALANQGFYDNLAFVRSSKTDGIVQAGSPDQTNQTANTGPGYTVQAETPTTAPGGSAYPIGTVAFGKSGSEPAGSADSQFFIATGSQALGLTPDYAIIGRVTKGLNVAQKIESFAPDERGRRPHDDGRDQNRQGHAGVDHDAEHLSAALRGRRAPRPTRRRGTGPPRGPGTR